MHRLISEETTQKIASLLIAVGMGVLFVHKEDGFTPTTYLAFSPLLLALLGIWFPARMTWVIRRRGESFNPARHTPAKVRIASWGGLFVLPTVLYIWL